MADTHSATLLAIWALFALSLGLMWGYAGILSFGHAAYFGLGAYTYAITAMNTGESTAAQRANGSSARTATTSWPVPRVRPGPPRKR